MFEAMKGRLQKIKRETDVITWRYSLVFLIVIVLLGTGFLYAAKAHFSAMNYSMKNERLQKEIEELENNQRKLKLKKEIASSPSEVEKAARRLGFRQMSPQDIQVLSKAKSVNNNSSEEFSREAVRRQKDGQSAEEKQIKYAKTGDLKE